ncbi:hypothetical protein GCM10022281_04370 [Sphingomonas rosea]|uniref:Uncharacterized protein n=1 Tax=Sphingomonas rosea TaxID=335605 RepID=A0ABP7TMJ6_9SPHN
MILFIIANATIGSMSGLATLTVDFLDEEAGAGFLGVAADAAETGTATMAQAARRARNDTNFPPFSAAPAARLDKPYAASALSLAQYARLTRTLRRAGAGS